MFTRSDLNTAVQCEINFDGWARARHANTQATQIASTLKRGLVWIQPTRCVHLANMSMSQKRKRRGTKSTVSSESATKEPEPVEFSNAPLDDNEDSESSEYSDIGEADEVDSDENEDTDENEDAAENEDTDENEDADEVEQRRALLLSRQNNPNLAELSDSSDEEGV